MKVQTSDDGKYKYVPTKEKILFLTESEYIISHDTEVTLDTVIDKNNKLIETAMVKATVEVSDPASPEKTIAKATGHCYRTSTEKYPAVETAETIATGRALSMLGISLDECGIASEEELQPRSRVYANQGRKAVQQAEIELDKRNRVTAEDFHINSKPKMYNGLPVFSSEELRIMTAADIYKKFKNVIPKFSDLDSFFDLVGEKKTKKVVATIVKEFYKGEIPFKNFMREKYNFDILSGTLLTKEREAEEVMIAKRMSLTEEEKKESLNEFYTLYSPHCNEPRSDEMVGTMLQELLVVGVEKGEIYDVVSALGFNAKYDSHYEFLKRCSANELFAWLGYILQ